MQFNNSDQALIAIFVQSQKEIEHLYLQAIRAHNTQQARYYLQQAQKLVDLLETQYQDWSITRGAEEYLAGFQMMGKHKRGVNPQPISDTKKIFTHIGELHTEAVYALVQSGNRAVHTTLDGIKKDIVYGVSLLKQQTKDRSLQHAIQAKIGAGIFIGTSVTQTKSDLVRFFETRGLSLRDRSGRKRNPQSYAEMLIRTERTRAYNAGLVNRGIELGVTTYRVEESNSCCSICAKHNGKIVDIKKVNYELPPYHPNCRGTVVPVWGEDLISDNQLDLLFNNIGSNKKVSFIFDSSISRETYDILKSLNMKPNEYKHELSNHWLKHIMRRHGVGKASWKNEVPVTKEEIKKIWIIVKYSDTTILSDHNSKSWHKVIIYRKEIEGKHYSYLEFIDTKTKKLTTQTMYINKKQ